MAAPSPTPGAPVHEGAPRSEDGLAEEDGTGTITWWVMLIIGLAITAYGIRGLVDGLATARLLRWVGWFAGGLLLHDLVAVPVYSSLGLVARRGLPRNWLAPVQVGAILTAVIALPTWPVLRGYGRSVQSGNATILPFDYATNLGIVLGIIWAAVLVAGIWTTRVRGRAPTEADLPVVSEDEDDVLARLDFDVAPQSADDVADDRELVLMADGPADADDDEADDDEADDAEPGTA